MGATGMEAAMAVYEMVTRFDYGTVIDTANKNVEETVKEIIGYVNNPSDAENN